MGAVFFGDAPRSAPVVAVALLVALYTLSDFWAVHLAVRFVLRRDILQYTSAVAGTPAASLALICLPVAGASSSIELADELSTGRTGARSPRQ